MQRRKVVPFRSGQPGFQLEVSRNLSLSGFRRTLWISAGEANLRFIWEPAGTGSKTIPARGLWRLKGTILPGTFVTAPRSM